MKILRVKHDSPPSSSSVQLDWRAYYYRFVEEHGQPVPWKNRLLFPDGWTYSNVDYTGPEYPPPTDPEDLLALRVYYWGRKIVELEKKLRKARNEMEALRRLQQQRSVPLQCPVVYWDDDGKKRRRLRDEARTRDADLEEMFVTHRSGIIALETEITRCRAELNQLQEKGAEHVKS